MRITAIITHYRNAAYVGEAIASVLGQTRPPDEILLIDDASPAADAVALETLPPQVRLIRRPVNGGAGAARQQASELATGDWLAYLDADDLWVPTKLERQVAFLADHPEAVAVHTGTVTFSLGMPDKVFLHKPAIQRGERSVLQAESMPSSLLVHRETLLRVGGWALDRGLIEDWDLEIRLTNQAGPVWFIAEPLTRIRRADHGNLSSRPMLNVSRQLRTIWHHRQLTTRLHGSGVWRAVASRVILDEQYKARGMARGAIWGMSRLLRVGAPKVPPH